MALTQLVYHSRNRGAGAGTPQLDLLRSVLAVSRRNNERDGLTGFLLFDRVWFVQVLEGERAGLMAAYGRIQDDRRHGDVTLMSMRDVRARSFPRWSMGGAMRQPEQREIFLRHGIGDRLDPNRLVAPSVVALVMDLQDYEIGRTPEGPLQQAS